MQDSSLITKSKSIALFLVLVAFVIGNFSCSQKISSSSAIEYGATALNSTQIVSTYDAESDIVNAPTVVCDVTTASVLSALSGDVRPSNAILRFDSDCNIIGVDGLVLGKFKDIYNHTLKGRIIPIIYVTDDATADAVIKFLQEEIDILDMAVMSYNPAIVKKIREANTKIRGIITYKDGTNLKDMVKVTNMSYANVAVIPQSMATVENVRYVQSRLKTVWVIANSADNLDLYNCINSGAYGVITPQFEKVYSILHSYEANTLFHAPFNVAHRGLPKQCNENSVSGTLKAMRSGATHVEIDGWLTTDGEIMIMHDANIKRTTTGTGHIESFSTTELKDFTLTMENEPIPSLTDIIKTLKGSDVILVFEIKSTKPEFIDRLREVLTQEDFFEQIVVISFHNPMLTLMKEIIPEVPTANLNNVSEITFQSDLCKMNELNTGVDISLSSTSPNFNENYLRDRGIIGWYFTCDDKSSIDNAVSCGYVGITNNEADSYASNIAMIKGADQIIRNLAVGSLVKLEATTYAGNKSQIKGEVVYCIDRDDKWEVVAMVSVSNFTYYTQSFLVSKNLSQQGNGLTVVGSIIGGFAGLAIIICLVMTIIKRRKSVKTVK